MWHRDRPDVDLPTRVHSEGEPFRKACTDGLDVSVHYYSSLAGLTVAQGNYRHDWKYGIYSSCYHLGWATIPVVLSSRPGTSYHWRSGAHCVLPSGDVLAKRPNSECHCCSDMHSLTSVDQVPRFFFTNRTTFSGCVHYAALQYSSWKLNQCWADTWAHFSMASSLWPRYVSSRTVSLLHSCFILSHSFAEYRLPSGVLPGVSRCICGWLRCRHVLAVPDHTGIRDRNRALGGGAEKVPSAELRRVDLHHHRVRRALHAGRNHVAGDVHWGSDPARGGTGDRVDQHAVPHTGTAPVLKQCTRARVLHLRPLLRPGMRIPPTDLLCTAGRF